MIYSFKLRRAIVLVRRARRIEVRENLQSWSWWSDQIMFKLFPFCTVVFLFFVIGFCSGSSYVGKAIDLRFVCQERTDAH